MDAIQSNMKKIGTSVVEWSRNKRVSLMNWLSSAELEEFINMYPYRTYFFLFMTPLFLVVPIFTILGSFSLMTSYFLAGAGLFAFSICSLFVFLIFPAIIIYIKFKEHHHRRTIWTGSAVITGILMIYWGFHYYQWFLPAL
ncbi:hypothetical protein GWK91_01235 [Virgibacillus sp. MSP4-1]|uniref:hypothetical protein n=1 Tax=Virgibacillus sp. MSP4-1 TaxID=2700081 RepID=UPI0003A431BC|nr:hypothetical protein [Virgibacillus sp. MSP4-1]QHS21658.1 hypothetical protein GWK91_01235 [Virgibacillus sp. MSP4-1]